jgi:serine/threonine-protein phosphatase 2B regulatory subunit
VLLPFVAVAEFVFFALTDCLADICPSPSSSASRIRRDPSASSFFLTAKKTHHRRRVGPGCISLDFRNLARLADESRCCTENKIFPSLFPRHFFLQCRLTRFFFFLGN